MAYIIVLPSMRHDAKLPVSCRFEQEFADPRRHEQMRTCRSASAGAPGAAGSRLPVAPWFSRLHPRYRTPTNSILLAIILVAALLGLASAGVHAAEAFAILNNASNVVYGLVCLVMFMIPVFGAKLIRDRIPSWVAVLCVVGFCATFFSVVTSAYPFVDVSDPLRFAIKILAAAFITNIIGYAFYRVRR